MDDAGRLWLVRHGETEWSAAGRHTGLTDLPLTARGEQEAMRTGALLRSRIPAEARVWTSPLQRAVRTAELAGMAGMAGAAVDPRLAERHYGPVEGLSTADVRTRIDDPRWDVWDDDLHPGPSTTPPPGAYIGPGESLSEVGVRCDALLADVRAVVDGGGHVVLVAHSHLHRVLAARWCGLDPDAGRHLVLRAAGVGELGYERRTPAILAWNA